MSAISNLINFFADTPHVPIDKVMEHDRELYREIDRLKRRLAVLEGQPNIAREAINRFCHPETYKAADKWLREKGL